MPAALLPCALCPVSCAKQDTPLTPATVGSAKQDVARAAAAAAAGAASGDAAAQMAEPGPGGGATADGSRGDGSTGNDCPPPPAHAGTAGAPGGAALAAPRPAPPRLPQQQQQHHGHVAPGGAGDVLGALRVLWHAEATHITVVGDLPYAALTAAAQVGGNRALLS